MNLTKKTFEECLAQWSGEMHGRGDIPTCKSRRTLTTPPVTRANKYFNLTTAIKCSAPANERAKYI